MKNLEGRRYTCIGQSPITHKEACFFISFVHGVSVSESIYLVLQFWTLEGCCSCEIEKMGDVMLKIFIFFCVLLFSWIWRLFYTIWWRPMKLQSYLNQQGIHGHRYKLIHGNLKDMDRSLRRALSQPINLTHKIPSRVLPFLDQTIKSYGMSWVKDF